MSQTLDSLFHYYQTAINLRSYRQEVLASNIANADTPGYKARDFDFGAALTGAMQGAAGQTNPATVAVTDPGHLTGSSALDPVGHALAQSVAQLKYRQPSQDSIDGNTVDMDVERGNFANNAIHYEANLTRLTGEIKNLISAMQS